MKKLLACLLLVVLFSCGFANPEIHVFAEENPDNVNYNLILKRGLREGMIPVITPPTDKHPQIEPVWRNGKAYFVDPEGIAVYTNLPNIQQVNVHAGKELIMEEYLQLPDNGNYYERLYVMKTLGAFKMESYLSNAWAKSYQYQVINSTTINWTHTGSLDLSLKKMIIAHYQLQYTKSTQESVGIFIHADESKYSKLALFVQRMLCSGQFQIYLERNGEVVRNEWEYGVTKTPHDYRYDIVYQEN